MVHNFISEYRKDLNKNLQRVQNTPMKLITTELGLIEYIDIGEGQPVLLVHGIAGGADQAADMAKEYLGEGFRIIGVNRFGYLNSPLPFNSSPTAQADLYAALLDKLSITKIVIAGTSAGGPSVLQFAIRHPERCSALVLWSMAVPGNQIPSKWASFGLKTFFQSNFLLWMMMKFFPKKMHNMMGEPTPILKTMSPSQKEWLNKIMWSLFPTSVRINGIMNDIQVSNPNLNRNYPLEKIKSPALMIHAMDDPMPAFDLAKQMAARIPNAEFMPVSSGGHLLIGHTDEVRNKINQFIKLHSQPDVEEKSSVRFERKESMVNEPPTFFY